MVEARSKRIKFRLLLQTKHNYRTRLIDRPKTKLRGRGSNPLPASVSKTLHQSMAG
jgi:hypothetical protein